MSGREQKWKGNSFYLKKLTVPQKANDQSLYDLYGDICPPGC